MPSPLTPVRAAAKKVAAADERAAVARKARQSAIFAAIDAGASRRAVADAAGITRQAIERDLKARAAGR